MLRRKSGPLRGWWVGECGSGRNHIPARTSNNKNNTVRKDCPDHIARRP